MRRPRTKVMARRRRLHGLAAALFVGMCVDATAAALGVCSTPLRTLSLGCGGRCEANQTCLSYSLAEPSPCQYEDASARALCSNQTQSSPNESCGYQCYDSYKSSSVFKFFVTFNTTRPTKPPPSASGSYASPASDSMDSVDDVPFENNAFIGRIGALDLPKSIREVVITGGRTKDMSARGTVVDVEIAADAFSLASQVTAVSFRNVDLGRHQSDIAAVVPHGTTQLDVSNTNLSQVPASLGRLAMLDSLTLSRNAIADFPSNLSLPMLTELQLSENQLTSFSTVDLTRLELLDLSANLLTQFPYEALTSLPKLRILRVDGNKPLKKVVFTSDHFSKLARLTTFAIDSSALDNSSCQATQVQQLPQATNQSVCVVSVKEWKTLQQRSQPELLITPASTSSSSKAFVVGGIVAVVVLVGIVTFLVKRRAKRRRSADAKAELEHVRTRTLTEQDPQVCSYEEVVQSPSTTNVSKIYSLRNDTELRAKRIGVGDIEDIRVIGTGGFAVVWLVNYRPQNRLLASKRLIRDQLSRKKAMEFVAEIKLSMRLVHANVVEFVGVAWTIESDLQAMFEFMSGGDLRGYLEASPATPWSEQKLKMVIDIIDALVYVHSFSPPLVHRDLKSRNVLLTEDMQAKLSDFGVSRFESERGTMTYGVGTGRWLAPEVIAGSRSYDSSCDIYSFGVLLSEIDSHELPYENLRGPQDNMLPDVAILQLVASGQLKPTMGETCPAALKGLAAQCVAFNAADRPTAVSVAASLRAIEGELEGSGVCV